MDFSYSLKVEILFGKGKIDQLDQICKSHNLKNGLLVCDPMFAENGLAAKVVAFAPDTITCVFSDITPNPTVENVNACTQLIRDKNISFIVALGGGSSLDCAKAASVVAYTGHPVQYFHSQGGKVIEPGIPVLAVPTTAGTGSEVTNVAVLSDHKLGIKGPMASDFMYPKLAIIDPLLTLTVPAKVVASTGLDVLSHALEGYWSKNHQPICDAYAIYAAKIVFENLYRSYSDNQDIDAREKMCVASLIAGLAFAHPKTAASHACSFPLTNIYHIPHGEACAFTLDALIGINSEVDFSRINEFARMAGFTSPHEMQNKVTELKKKTGMCCTLMEAGIDIADLPKLVGACKHPNLLNNPVEMTEERLMNMFLSMK